MYTCIHVRIRTFHCFTVSATAIVSRLAVQQFVNTEATTAFEHRTHTHTRARTNTIQRRAACHTHTKCHNQNTHAQTQRYSRALGVIGLLCHSACGTIVSPPCTTASWETMELVSSFMSCVWTRTEKNFCATSRSAEFK